MPEETAKHDEIKFGEHKGHRISSSKLTLGESFAEMASDPSDLGDALKWADLQLADRSPKHLDS